MNSHSITFKSLFQYGFIALPVAFAGFPLYVLAPDFYATRHALSLTLLGTLLLAIRLFDAVQDPLIGWLTDRLQGRFLWLVIAAGGLLCLSIFGLFNGLVLGPVFWFSVCMLFATSAYSILIIVLGAQATLWTANKVDQTRIAGAREACGLIGLIIAVSMPPILSNLLNPTDVYLWYGVILSFLMGVGLVNFWQWRKNLSTTVLVKQNNRLSPLLACRSLPKESLQLFGVYALSMLASSIPAVLVIFFIRDLLNAAHLTGLFLLLYFLSGTVAMPLWKKVSVRIGKVKTWRVSNMVAVVGFIGAYFLNSGDVWPYAVVCGISGLALGADLTLPPSILADHIHERGNSAFSGTHYAFLAFITKASLALASAIVLPTLDLAGFKPQTVNSEQALRVLSVSYALIPCVLKLAAAGLLYYFFIRSHPISFRRI